MELATGFPLDLYGAAEAKRKHDFYLPLDQEIRKIDLQQLSFADEINAALLCYSFEDQISDYTYSRFG